MNFHEYIDLKENILVIVELSNQHLVAGYYHGKLSAKMTADKDALIVSLTNKEVFELKEPNKRGTVYDH